jgi:hypothetical protein
VLAERHECQIAWLRDLVARATGRAAPDAAEEAMLYGRGNRLL